MGKGSVTTMTPGVERCGISIPASDCVASGSAPVAITYLSTLISPHVVCRTDCPLPAVVAPLTEQFSSNDKPSFSAALTIRCEANLASTAPSRGEYAIRSAPPKLAAGSRPLASVTPIILAGSPQSCCSAISSASRRWRASDENHSREPPHLTGTFSSLCKRCQAFIPSWLNA